MLTIHLPATNPTLASISGQLRFALMLLTLFTLGNGSSAIAIEEFQLQILVVDQSGQTIPCRIHLRDKNKKPIRPPQLPFWHDHFVCDGTVTLKLADGKYDWTIEKGPEFERKSGTIVLSNESHPDKKSQLRVTLGRIANLRSKGWRSGDLHVHRNPRDIQLLMRAEDLDFCPVVTWWNRPAKNIKEKKDTVFRFDNFRLYTKMAGEDEREGGALLFFGLNRPLDLTVKSREYPSPMDFVRQAREINSDVWIDIEKPFWWDVPVWLASKQMNSIGLANNHMCRSQMLASEAWGKARDPKRLPAPRGNGFWTQEIYYQILNSDIRLPPSAGSASGVLPNPVGYNRVYAYCDQDFTRDSWFQAMKQGKLFVTNGPLLTAKADNLLPGGCLKLETNVKPIRFKIDLTSNDHVSNLEVVFNGKVIKEVPCSNKRTQRHEFTIDIDQPGWFLVRAITDVKETFRFASTAPWYVESVTGKRYLSRQSAQFFRDWTKERIERLKSNVKDKIQLSQIIKHHDRALSFWEDKVARSTFE